LFHGKTPAHVGTLLISIFSVACMAMIISLPVESAQPEFAQIIDIDDYSKSAVAGGSNTYNWTARSVSAENLTVNVTTHLTGDGWSCSLSSQSLTLIPNGLGSVVLRVTAPLDNGDMSSNITLTFNVYEGGYLVQATSAFVVTTISGTLASADKVIGIWNNPLPAPIDNEIGVFLLDVVIWLIVAVTITYLMDLVVKRLTKKTTTMVDDIVLSIIRTPLILLIFAYGALQSLEALHKHIPEDIRVSLIAAYQVILVLVIFYVAYKMFKEILLYYGKLIAKKTASKIDDILIPVVEKIGVVVIGLVAAGYLLSVLNVDLSMFVAGGVVVSMVLAFAAQETLSNFFSGIFILLDRPFTEGDTVILADGDWCEIRRIGLRTSRLYRFSDATVITLPNNRLVNEKIVRVTNVEDPAKVVVNVGVAYGTDPAKAREAIMNAVKSSPYSLLTDKNRQPLILFDEMADSSIVFKTICWLNDPDKRIEAQDRLTEEIYRKLNEAGVEIALPQRVVHLKKSD